MAARQGLGLARLICQRGRRATRLLESSLDASLPIAAVRWRGRHQSANHSVSSESPGAFLSSNSSDEDPEERIPGPAPTANLACLRSAPFRLHPHHSASSLDLPYTVRWSSPGLESAARWFSSKPGAALGSELQGSVAEALKAEDGERLQKETSASEAAACDDAVNSLSEAQKKAKQKEAAKKDKTILQQAFATLVGIPAALRAVFAMSRADWVRTCKGWGVAIKETAQHYWVGTKLLWADVRVASRLLLKVANGKSLSRRERKQLTRTVADVFRLVPFAIFVIVPFMEFLLPVFLRFFPNMLPSTFQDKMKEEELMKKKLQARLQYARFLQETVGEMAREVKSTSTGEKKKTAEDLVAFMQKVRTGQHVSNDDIVNFAKLFNDELTLDNISRPRLVSMCKYMGLSPFGTDAYLRYTLRARLAWIKEDDKLIQREGVDSLTEKELRSACRQRGMLMVGNMTEDEMRTEIREWLDLSLNRSLPSSLLILSRAFKASPTSSLEDTVQATLSSLPDELVDELGMTELGEEDTLAQRTRKLEYLKRQEELIKAEEKRAKKEEEEKKKEEEAEKQAARDVALEEMKTATAKGLGFDTEAEAPLAHTVARAKAIDQREELCKLSEALAVLASASSVSKERTEFLNMVNKEIEMYNRMVEKEGTDGEEEAKRLFFEAKKEVDRAALEGEEGGGGPSQALIKRVDSLLHKLEKEIDDVDAKIGDRWRILDRDYDGKVSPDEVAAAAAFLKSELGEEPVQQLIANLAKDKDGKILVEDIVKLGTMAETEEQKNQQESSSG